MRSPLEVRRFDLSSLTDVQTKRSHRSMTTTKAVPHAPSSARTLTSRPVVRDGGSARVDAQAFEGPPLNEDALGIEAFHALDRTREALVAQLTGGLSPVSLGMAFLDWATHLSVAPGKQAELIWKLARKSYRLQSVAFAQAAGIPAPPTIAPLPGDRRFADPAWNKAPYNLYAQAFLLSQQWWHNVTHEVPGVSPHHEQVVSFLARQWLDVLSPSNNPWLNPEILQQTRESAGANLASGLRNLQEDIARFIATGARSPAHDFVVGRDLATTPGKVIARNELMELLQ
jgi:polyhydroxyalkanoate synthase subunit PhaC